MLHSQQPVGRGTLQFAHDFTSSTGIPVHSVPTGAGLGWSDTSRTRLHRIQLPAATERSEATYFPEGTPGGEEGESTTSDSILREAGNEVGRALRYGEPQEGRQGQRSDLLALKSALDEGSTDLQLWEEFFPTMMRYYKGVAQYQILKRDQRRWKSKVYVLVGEPGTGKSKWALDNFPNAYWKQRGNWWDGYHHDEVVLDDFYGWLPFDTLLRLLDRYPLLVETKGGQASFIAKTIVITSNALPREWYQNIRNYSALARRIDVVMKFTGENQFIEININELD